MTMSSTSTKPAKGLRLTQAAREDVRQAFERPLKEQNLKDRTAARTEWAKKIDADLYTAEEIKALKVLKKGGFVSSVTEAWLDSKEQNDKGNPIVSHNRHHFGDATIMATGIGSKRISLALMKEYDALDEAFNARLKDIEALVKELNSVLLTAKTRTELAALWPGAETLMGETWIWAQAEPNTLPTVQTTNITAALEQIQKAA